MVSPPSAGLFQRVIQQSNPAGFSYTTPGYMAVYGDVRRPRARMHSLRTAEANNAAARRAR